MSTIFLRALLLYVLMIAAIRALGKRQLNQFQPYEFAMTMVIADLVATPISDISTPLLHGALPIAALIVLHTALTWICMRSDRARSVISGRPSIVVNHGVVDEAELRRLSMSLSDLVEGIRECGILDPRDVDTVIVEADGSVNAFSKKSREPASAQDAGVPVAETGIPLLLVADGRVQRENLRLTKRDEAWLNGVLAPRGKTSGSLLLASLDTQGLLHIQDKTGNIFDIQAMEPGEANW